MARKSFYSVLSVIIAVFLLAAPASRMSAYAKTPAVIPFIILTDYTKTLSVNEEFYLIAVTSTGKMPAFKSSKSSIASVNTYGLVTAKKSGTCKITAKIKNAEASCKVTVKKTGVTLSAAKITLYRNGTQQLRATVTSGSAPTWKSSRSSVATVDENGLVTAVKHGTAKITCKADGVSKTCAVTVKQPTVKLTPSTLKLSVGESRTLKASVSSGNAPVWSTSNLNIVDVDENGTITARQKGRAYIYAREDGVKASCIVTVTEP